MRKTWIVLLGHFVFLGNVNVLLAQPNKVNKAFEDDIYQSSIALLDLVQGIDNQELSDDEFLVQIDALFGYVFTDADTLSEQLWDEKIKSVERDFGLNLSARYTHNGDLIDDVLEPGSRWRAGLEWDVLEDGWLDRKQKKEQLKNEQKLFELERDLKSRVRNYPFIYNKIIYTFNQEKIKLLNRRIPYLESWLDVLTDLYFIHDVKYTEVLDVRKKLEESKSLLHSYQSYNQIFKHRVQQDTLILEATMLPILDIDMDEILGDTIHEQLMNQIVETRKQAMMLGDDENKLPRLKLFGNYNVQSQNFRYNRSYGTLGAQFNMPLDFNKKEKKRIQYLEGEVIEDKANFAIYNNVRELLNLYTEYSFNMKKYIEFLHKKVRLQELLRIERVLLEYDKRGHSALSALNYQDMIIAMDLELLGVQHMMYLKLAQIATKSHHPDFISCLKRKTFEGIGQKLEGTRFVILGLNDLENNFTFLTNYLEKNELKTVILKDGIPIVYFKKLREAGITVFAEYNPKLEGMNLKAIPMEKFFNRNHLEFWISSVRRGKPDTIFLFKNINELIELDRKNKQLTSR